MHLHHVAIGARHVGALARFYSAVFDLPELRRHRLPDGALRSIWLDAGGIILMIEACGAETAPVQTCRPGPFLLAFSSTPSERAALEQKLAEHGAVVESRTEWTSYARDPEGNRVAISHYDVTGRLT